MAVDIDRPISDALESLRIYFNSDYLFAFVLIILFLVLALVISFIYKNLLMRICSKTKTKVDDLLVEATEKPIIYFILIIGIKTVIMSLSLKGDFIGIFNKLLSSLLVVLFAYVFTKSVDLFIYGWGRKWLKSTRSKYGDTIFPIFMKIVNLVIIIATLIAILGIWGVQVAPFLAGLGIVGLVIGLAVQDSLRDFLSGIMLILDRTYKTGDKVRLDSGEVGSIHEITLRSTRIRTYDNNVIIIPNSKMADSKIINYAQPKLMERGQVPFGVVYGSDIEKTKAVALKAVKKVELILEDPEPCIEFLDLADYSLTFRALFWVDDFGTKWGVERKVVDNIYNDLNEAGIEFAFPTKTVHLYRNKINEEDT